MLLNPSLPIYKIWGQKDVREAQGMVALGFAFKVGCPEFCLRVVLL